MHSTSIYDLINETIHSDSFVISFLGMFFGVAVVEEACKQLFIYLTIWRSKTVLMTRTVIFYGMIAGLAFGIFEGLQYQLTINKELAADENYFYNILRLTSLPFFHAIWAGIGAYSISMGDIILKYRKSFRLVAILIPSTLHALYNVFGFSIIGILVTVLSAVILTTYLTQADSIVKIFSN